MDNIKDIVKEEFNKIAEDAQIGITLNLTKDDFSYVRFNLILEGKLFGKSTEEDYLGSEENINEEYEAEYSNGTINYIPTLIVNNKEEFFNTLTSLVKEYYSFYELQKANNAFGVNNIVKQIILTILSNARYADYQNIESYMNRYIRFIKDNNKFERVIDNIDLLQDSNIEIKTKKEEFGYETPYYMESVITKDNFKYYLPNISYAIDEDTCYIYAIQNKHKNEDNQYTKRIKRLINKVNENVTNETEYDDNNSILGVPPSFVLALSIFLKELKNNNIEKVEVITFLPDRYFEKKATDSYDADLVQKNLTERLVMLMYRIKHHINEISIDYPLYDGIFDNSNIGENLILNLPENIECENNQLLKEIYSKMNEQKNHKM